MAVSFASNRVTVNGAFASGTATITASTTLVRTGGSASSSTWIGRLIAFIPSATSSANTQVRLVTGVSGNNITVNDAWLDKGDLSGDFRVAHNCQDVHDIGNASLQKIGDRTFRWNGDWSISSTGFFGDIDISLEMEKNSGAPMWPEADGAIVQFGLLIGGENNNSIETTNGCQIYFNKGSTSTTSYYTDNNARKQNGPINNYYGCLVNSTSPNDSAWSFMRMNGPNRFIGCVFDGHVGGRFYHENSEWVDCRMSGNNNTTTSWSMGATFNRGVSNVVFYQNLGVIKNFQSFTGEFRDCIFTASNVTIFLDSGNEDIDFIDCTTFTSSSTNVVQYKSVKYTVTDASGTSIEGVKVRINDANDDVQDGIQTSDAAGDVPAVNARFRQGSTSFGPFRIRIRNYGKLWTEIASSIDDKIVQSVAMPDNPGVTLLESAVTPFDGNGSVTITDASVLSLGGKSFSIQVTVDTTVDPGPETLDELKHYLHWFGAQNTGMAYHEFITMSSTETQGGTYGTDGFKGVAIVDENGDPYPGVTRMQSDDGTFYIPPVNTFLTLTGLEDGSEVRVYDAGTTTELDGEETVIGGSFTTSLSVSSVDISVVSLGFQNLRLKDVVTTSDTTIPIQQVIDRVYSNPV